MGFMEAIGAFYRGYVNFETRSSRSEYWWPKLYKTLVYFVIFMLMGVMAELEGGMDADESNMVVGIFGLIIVLFYISNILPNIAIAVRRFHDQNQSGWMFLLVLIPYIGGLIVMIFMCIDGTHGENRFGEDPLGENMLETFS